MTARNPNYYIAAAARRSPGRLMADALYGSWRGEPAPLEMSARELEGIMTLLLKSGSGALVRRRLMDSAAERSQFLEELERAYRVQLLAAAVHERNIKEALKLLRAAGIEPVLVKGWAIARLYREPALRPYGDIDLCVRAREFRAAQEVLASEEGRKLWVDLHEGFTALDARDEDELWERTQLVLMGETRLRVLSEEDHLRVLCLHLLRHGAWRPLWLCDIGVALESRSADFDWQLFSGEDEREAGWLACVIGLAHQLLGAKVADIPLAERAQHPPRWLERAVLRRWSWWFDSDYRDGAAASLRKHLSEPVKFLRDIYFRCDPIRATVEMKGAFNDMPRAPYQLAALLRRSPEFPRHMARLLRG